MNWGSAQEFFAMGGYGPYVWGSYAVAAACIVLELVFLRQRRRTVERALSRRAGERSSKHSSGQT
jgi:heme exporter protein D